MPMSVKDTKAYRADEQQGHHLLTEAQRQAIFKASLPSPNDGQAAVNNKAGQSQRRSRLGVRRFLKNQIFVFVFAVMHGIFSLYIKSRQTWHGVAYQISSILYYHHATPQYIRRDIMGLSKKPKHLSAILKTEGKHRAKNDIDRLIEETAELATWCACAEIPMLSIYEKSGVLKKHMPRVYEAVIQKFTFYFGTEHPTLSDGRESIVDLTRTLADMSQRGKISPRDISQELVDAELSEGIFPEPDLLILFTPYVELSGYPPWQIRLTEIFCLQDNETFGYQVFLKALRNFASAQMRRGK
ncbi:hypothetical protein TrVFT333_000766 [Trichoderma virens FT-333]|nr:hypothetical protein TrVFT333_000766 [Trichoderma virens FT-333]